MACSESVFLADILPTIRSELDNGRCVRIYPKGISMEPMLKGGRDSVMLAPLTAPVKKYDVVLYRRENGQFVLHRVVKVHDGLFDFCGDNQLFTEKNIPQERLIAVVSSFVRNGRHTGCTNAAYGVYSRLLCLTRLPRRLLVRLRHLAGTAKQKIKRIL